MSMCENCTAGNFGGRRNWQNTSKEAFGEYYFGEWLKIGKILNIEWLILRGHTCGCAQ